MKPRTPITIGTGPVSSKMNMDPRYALAQGLMSDSDTSNSEFAGLNNAISKMMGAYTQKKVGQDFEKRDTEYNDTMSRALGAMLGGPAEQDVNNPNITWDAREPDLGLARKLMAANPDTADQAQQLAMTEYQTNVASKNADKEFEREKELLQFKDSLEDPEDTTTDFQKDFAFIMGMPEGEREAAMRAKFPKMFGSGTSGSFDPETGEFTPGYSDKPMPAAALKLQQEAMEALGNSKNITNTASLLRQQLQTGALDVGPIKNLVSEAKNFAGRSDTQSQAYANLNTALEKLRNDTLLLHKGVQTEGDAVRAMNQIIKNKNDPEVLMDALSKLEELNVRGAELQRMNVNNIRSNYNQAPMDFDAIDQTFAPAPTAPKVRKFKDKSGAVFVLKNGKLVPDGQ